MNRIFLLSLFSVSLFLPLRDLKAKTIVQIDGSSTVYPVSAAVAEEFQQTPEAKGTRVTVAYSGTGGGFKKWCKGETDINDASRPIKGKEKQCAEKNGISYIELPVAYDGLSVVVSQKNKFVKTLTVAQLKKLWEAGSKVTKWSDLDPSWPAEAVRLYGPGHDSGTFDYFTEVVLEKARSIRTDAITNEDDNALVKGVSASPYALGYFGYAYYLENKRSLRAVAIDNGKGPVLPSEETVENGTYNPLSRPIFIYVSSKAVSRPEVRQFVKYYLSTARDIVKSVGYIPMPEAKYQESLKKFDDFYKKVASNAPKSKSAE